jgi:hypothetical protein
VAAGPVGSPLGFATVVGCRSHASWVIAMSDGTSMTPMEFHVNRA